MKNWADMLKNITMLTQFGLSFVTPVFLCLALCWWLNIHMGVGAWVYIPGFFFGLGGSFMVAYKLYLKIMEEQKKEDKKSIKKCLLTDMCKYRNSAYRYGRERKYVIN